MSDNFANLSTRTKLMAIVAAMMVPVAMLFWFDISRSQHMVNVALSEDLGNDWARTLISLQRNLVEHRDHVFAVAAGHDDELAEMREHDGHIRAAIAGLDQLATEEAGGFSASVDWKPLRAEAMAAVDAEVKDPRNHELHNSAIAHTLLSLDRLVNDAGLTLDSDPASLALIDAYILQLPKGLQSLAQARRDYDAVIAGDGSPQRRVALGQQLGQAQAMLAVAFSDLADRYRQAEPDDKASADAASAAEKSFDELVPRILSVGEGKVLSAEQLKQISEHTEELTETLADMQDKGLELLESRLQKRVHDARVSMATHVAVVALCLALAILIAIKVTRYLASRVRQANEVFERMSQGQLDSQIGEQAADELGVLLTALARMQDGLRSRIEAERVVSEGNSRIRQSLDASSASVMVADAERRIIYVNRAAQALMSGIQSDIRAAVPGFDAAALMGSSIDLLHTNPAQQRNLLGSLSQTSVDEVRFGGRTLRITASPITGEGNVRLGTVVEWVDRTLELAMESEVQVVVAEALKGNLEHRIDLAGKAGFFKALSEGLNELVTTMGTVDREVRTMVGAATDGDLARRIELRGAGGLLQKIGAGINDLTANMETVVDEVQKLVAAANEGDLTQRIETEGSSGLLRKVGSGINQLAANMADIVSQVKLAASEVSRGADEISQGSTNLSQRTEEQASSLEETASSMEQMTSTVKQSADNAGQASQLAVAARDQAEKGGVVVSTAIRAMAGINEASRKIVEIISVIDEIAFQTNLLALNAAVEAARAGEQGRGFAVVAGEVRNLAGRSATAAKEIKALIQDSVRKVDEGSTLVTQSGATLEQIVSSVKKVTDIVAEIAAASNEQSAGIEQVNKAVMQLDELTQQNAALVEQASAASQAMAEQARGLNDSMQRYQVNGDVAAVPVAERRKASRPWAGGQRPATKALRTRTAPAAPVVAAGGSDAVWKEF
jgi:methyl-accepting chemotaxis protein